ncbi:MAG: hypothetical protein KAU49_03140 [Candidatus Krumholzibacteria bacterium]|nr:hypothetical protein [Candidatus Krumholzibacteria bacterium]
MSVRKMSLVAAVMLIVGIAVMVGCSDKPYNYTTRTIVYVSYMNDGMPYLCDVLEQGDSLYYEDTNIYKIDDDYIKEDRVKVVFHNRPYNSLIEPELSLGDFLVTGYTVEFVSTDGSGIVPVPPFTGNTSVLIPADEMVEAWIVIVPFGSKNVDPLVSMQYTPAEIYTNARITFTGHEVQTDREVTFQAGLHVNFGDPLITKTNKTDF